jgi:adenylate cyclase 10
MSSSSESKEKMKADALIMKNQINPSQFHLIKHLVLPYIPAALLPYIDIDEEKWSSELRYLTIVFINLGIDLRSAN